MVVIISILWLMIVKRGRSHSERVPREKARERAWGPQESSKGGDTATLARGTGRCTLSMTYLSIYLSVYLFLSLSLYVYIHIYIYIIYAYIYIYIHMYVCVYIYIYIYDV